VQTSIFIARLLGPFLLVMGIAVLARPERFRALAREFLDSEALIFLSGVLTLPAGLAIVNTHNVWQGWPAIVTLFGWLMVLAGVARMTMPAALRSLGAAILDRRPAMAAQGGFVAVLGAFLAWKGYLG
jgi:hypothetical protein